MATLQCERPRCNMRVEEANKTLAIQLLKLHDGQVHGGAWDSQAACPTMDTVINTPGPVTAIASSIEDTTAATMTGVTKDSSSQPLEPRLASEVVVHPGPGIVNASSVEDTAVATVTMHTSSS